jgi:hypothetical protein
MQNVNKQQAVYPPKIRVPKTSPNLLIKKGEEVKKEVKQPPRVVKHIDELYSESFLNDYFHV